MKRQNLFCLLLLVGAQLCFSNQYALRAQCTNCTNSFMNTGSAADIDYDNMVSSFHSSIVKQADGKVLVWGEDIANSGNSNELLPKELKTGTGFYPNLSGTILRFTAGGNGRNSTQFIVLTTTGLFAWGNAGSVLSTSVKGTAGFAKVTGITGANTYGLPTGVNPGDVKMLFGTYQTLALVTCSGAAYVISQNRDMRGAGHTWPSNTGSSEQWYQVTTSATGNPALSGIVALRGAPGGLMATNGTNVWTWGRDVYLGNNVDEDSYNRANPMNLTKPQGGTIVPKMIGMTGLTSRSSHYILGDDGFIYSMGDNSQRQLGDRSTSERQRWVRVLDNNSNALGNIVWISPNEHDGWSDGASAVTALTSAKKIWAWGSNSYNMLGATGGGTKDPFTPPGGLNVADNVIAVETGGHTVLVVKECSANFGYVGHLVNGSMGNNSSADNNISAFTFSGTATLDICGAQSGAANLDQPLPHVQPGNKYFVGEQYTLTYQPATGGTLTLDPASTAYATLVGNTLTITGKGNIKVTYTHPQKCAADDFTINAGEVSLPVVFGTLEASITGSQLFVNWSTEKETNNSHFEIEASTDGTNFTKIGEVVSKAKDGNSSTPLQYQFSIDVSSQIALGMGLLAFGTLGMALNRRRRLLAMLVILTGAAVTIAGCSKNETDSIDKGSKVFVKVVQVDIDGKKAPSKVVQAVGR